MENTSGFNYNQSFEASQPARVITGGVIFSFVAHAITFLLGVPGNCLILLVYWNKSRRTSTNILIMALAVADLSVCLLRLREIATNTLNMTGKQTPQFFTIVSAFNTTAVTCSVLYTAVIAADRYDCVCQPHNRRFTPRRTKVAVLASLVYSFVTNIPAFLSFSVYPSNRVMRTLTLASQAISFTTALAMIILCYGLVYRTIRRHVRVGILSETQRRSHGSSLGAENSSMNSHARVCETAISIVAAGTTTSVEGELKASLSHGVGEPTTPAVGHQFAVERETNSTAIKHDRVTLSQPNTGERTQRFKETNLQRKTTKMLFITSVVFLITWLPYWIAVSMELASYSGLYVFLSETALQKLFRSTVLLYVNNAINPVIYGLANRRFREDCKLILRKMRVC